MKLMSQEMLLVVWKMSYCPGSGPNNHLKVFGVGGDGEGGLFVVGFCLQTCQVQTRQVNNQWKQNSPRK
jgi:hypothetical protein